MTKPCEEVFITSLSLHVQSLYNIEDVKWNVTFKNCSKNVLHHYQEIETITKKKRREEALVQERGANL